RPRICRPDRLRFAELQHDTIWVDFSASDALASLGGLFERAGECWLARLAGGKQRTAAVRTHREVRDIRRRGQLADAEQCLDPAVAPLVRNEDARTFARYFCDIRGLDHVPPPSTALHQSSPGSSRHRRAGAFI